MNVVIDTNVLVSALWSKGGTCAKILYRVFNYELTVVYDQRINVIEKKDHETKLQLYIGYGIKELDDITFIPESGADTIVSIYIEGIKK